MNKRKSCNTEVLILSKIINRDAIKAVTINSVKSMQSRLYFLFQ